VLTHLLIVRDVNRSRAFDEPLLEGDAGS